MGKVAGHTRTETDVVEDRFEMITRVMSVWEYARTDLRLIDDLPVGRRVCGVWKGVTGECGLISAFSVKVRPRTLKTRWDDFLLQTPDDQMIAGVFERGSDPRKMIAGKMIALESGPRKKNFRKQGCREMIEMREDDDRILRDDPVEDSPEDGHLKDDRTGWLKVDRKRDDPPEDDRDWSKLISSTRSFGNSRNFGKRAQDLFGLSRLGRVCPGREEDFKQLGRVVASQREMDLHKLGRACADRTVSCCRLGRVCLGPMNAGGVKAGVSLIRERSSMESGRIDRLSVEGSRRLMSRMIARERLIEARSLNQEVTRKIDRRCREEES